MSSCTTIVFGAVRESAVIVVDMEPVVDVVVVILNNRQCNYTIVPISGRRRICER